MILHREKDVPIPEVHSSIKNPSYYMNVVDSVLSRWIKDKSLADSNKKSDVDRPLAIAERRQERNLTPCSCVKRERRENVADRVGYL